MKYEGKKLKKAPDVVPGRCEGCFFKGIVGCLTVECKNHIWVEDKEEDMKTKKVAVIWFGEVSKDAVKCQLYFDDKHDELTANPEQNVELIDIERIRYGHTKEGETILHPDEGMVKAGKIEAELWRGLIIDPPKKKETVKDVLARMPRADNYCLDRKSLEAFKKDMAVWQKDLKEAQEREE